TRLPSGQWLAFPISLLAAATEVFRHASANGYTVAYHVELARRPESASLAKLLIPALARLSTKGRQPALESALQLAVGTLKTAGWTARERIAVGDDQHRGWLENLVLTAVRGQFPFYPDDFWSLQADGATSSSPGGAIREARPPDYHVRVLQALAPSVAAGPVTLRRKPPLPTQHGDYVFLSYAHADQTPMGTLLPLLQRAGVRIWYDAGIAAGKVWDDELEQRIRNAGAVVAWLSPHYEASRYCTREIKFADLLEKPILPISASRWTWGAGLQLMFQPLQIASFDEGRGFALFLAALQGAAPQVFSG
ncbi:MAG TPA: toll/interleukin-1 receptor domain-containing protein, partial [Polyangiales bacterium]